MYVISVAVKIADEISKDKEVRRVMIFPDYQATLKTIQLDEPGPGQVLALRTINWGKRVDQYKHPTGVSLAFSAEGCGRQ
jgi:hypothetical protein